MTLITFNRPIAVKTQNTVMLVLVVEGDITDASNGMTNVDIKKVHLEDGSILDTDVMVRVRHTMVAGAQYTKERA